MKTNITIIALALILASCSKVINSGGPYTIKGTLLNNCEDQEPVANKELYFLIDWDTPEEERIGTTDANGYFEYTYEGPVNTTSSVGGSIRITNDKPVLVGIPKRLRDKVTDAGVIYANTPRHVDITFKIQGEGFTDKDTLILSRGFHTDLRIKSTLRIAGPFDEETVLTEEWYKYASSGAMTMSDYTGVTRPHVRRLYGTFGSLCYWQVRRNGEVYKENNVEILLDACEEGGTMFIDPNDGYHDEK